MIKIKVTLIIVSFSLFACGQKAAKRKINPTAVRLNDSAIYLYPYADNYDSVNKAVRLLDSATAIDSNYFLGYSNKLMFLNQLKQYDKAIVAVNNLIRLKPNANDIYFIGGIFYEKMGDTVSSHFYFQKSLIICSKILDTMNVNNKNYDMLVTNKAMDLIMLGQQANGNLLLKQVYENQTDSSQKELIYPFINKNKAEIIEIFSTPRTQDSKVSVPNRGN